MTRMTGVFVAAALAGGCGSSPSAPSPAPVRVTVAPNPTFSGDTLVFSMRVENISQAAVDLTFPSSCDVLPYFTDARTGQPVTPAGGGFACLAVITQRRLLPGEFILKTVLVKAGTAPDAQFVVLPPGEYAIQARLEDQVFRAQSDRVGFALR